MTGIVNRGKDLIRNLKSVEKIKILEKFYKKKKTDKVFSLIIGTKKGPPFEGRNLKNLKNSFFLQKKFNKNKLNLLNFYFNYHDVTKNRFLQFFEFSQMVLQKKTVNIFSGLIIKPKKKLVKNFIFKKNFKKKTK
mmetsp:Transcript_28189/g.57184  ORF Transcript_28189/g.57184 Transcript_28189/m.57184 type:complete len:135 (-) Transcript_28189:15-419(-)